MSKRRLSLLIFAVLVGLGNAAVPPTIITLPAPAHDGPMSLEKALSRRRSVREFRNDALTLAEVGQLLWAAQGISDSDGRRTAPSAGALFPLEVYAVVGRVGGHAPGVYRYQPRDHTLALVSAGDRRARLAGAALEQRWFDDAPLVVVIAAVDERTTRKYGMRGRRYVELEAGHAGENLCLQAAALGLGATVVGAFDDAAVQALLPLPPQERPLALIPVGRPR